MTTYARASVRLDGQPARRAVGFHVPGLPAPQGSKSAFTPHGQNATPCPSCRQRHIVKIVQTESSKAVEPWRAAVEAAALQSVGTPFTGPVFVTFLFTLPRPRAHYRTGRFADELRGDAPAYPAGTPDLDKLVRATMDGLTAGHAWADDAQAVRVQAVKQYPTSSVPGDTVPGCIITIADCEPENKPENTSAHENAQSGADARTESDADARAGARAETGEPECSSLPF